MLSYPYALAPQHIDSAMPGVVHPLAQLAHKPTYCLQILQPIVKKLFRLDKVLRRVLRHEDLGRRVYSRQRRALGVPARIHALIAGEKPNLVCERRKFV